MARGKKNSWDRQIAGNRLPLFSLAHFEGKAWACLNQKWCQRWKWARGCLPSAPERSTHQHRWEAEEKDWRISNMKTGTKKRKEISFKMRCIDGYEIKTLKKSSCSTCVADEDRQHAEKTYRGRFLLMRGAQEREVPRYTSGPTVTDPIHKVHWRFAEDLRPGYHGLSHGSFRLVSVAESCTSATLWSLCSHDYRSESCDKHLALWYILVPRTLTP